MPLPIRPHLAGLRSYLTSTPAVYPPIKLSANENPLGPSSKAIEAMRQAVEPANVYPDGAGRKLKAKLASIHGVHESQIALGAGSDELIRILGTMLLEGPATEVIAALPSFASYRETALFSDATLREIPVGANRSVDLEAMAEAINDRTRLIFLANPNNPTGGIVRKLELDRFLDRVPETTLVVLDEAYFEYAVSDPEYPSGIELLKSGRRICVLRTFSKIHSLAALRIGYAVANPELITILEAVRPPFNANSIAQAAALDALDDDEHIEKSLAVNSAALNRIAEMLGQMGAKTFPAYGNFVYAEFPNDATIIGKRLLEQGIAVRAGAQVWKPESIRISAGTPAQLDALEAALSTIEAEVPRA